MKPILQLDKQFQFTVHIAFLRRQDNVLCICILKEMKKHLH